MLYLLLALMLLCTLPDKLALVNDVCIVVVHDHKGTMCSAIK